MSTIEKKVEAAMRATSHYYHFFFLFGNDSDSVWKSAALRCRTLAVVQHDRYLNGR